MPGSRLPRYPATSGAPRCQACGGVINVERRGSSFDFVCNRLINPHAYGDGGSKDPGEVLRTPRPDPPGWEERRDLVRELHAELRGDRPGWGRVSVTLLEAEMAQKVAVWELNRGAADLMNALRGALGA